MFNRRWLALTLGLSLMGSAAAAQQTTQGQYTVVLKGGSTRFDNAAAFKNDLMLSLYGGLEANYYVRDNLALGGFMNASRPTTDPTYFPMNRLLFGTDTAVYFLPSQQVTLLEGGLQAIAGMAIGGVTLSGTGGAGIYRIDLDHQRSNRPVAIGREVRSLSGLALVVGGGVGIPLPGGGGLRFQVRDHIFTGYDREILSIAEPLLASDQIPHPRLQFDAATGTWSDPLPEAKTTVHNLRFEAGFTFRPGAAVGGGS